MHWRAQLIIRKTDKLLLQGPFSKRLENMTIQYRLQGDNFHPRQTPKAKVPEHHPLAWQAGNDRETLHPTETTGRWGEPTESIDPRQSDFKMTA